MGQEFKGRHEHEIVVLRNDETALTSTAAETAVTDAALKGYRAGYAVASVSAMVVNDTDELYVLTIEGRQAGSGAAYTVLGTITMGAAAAGAVAPFTLPGVFSVNIPNMKGDMRANTTISGTTPSINLNSVVLIVTRHTYGLSEDTTIAA